MIPGIGRGYFAGWGTLALLNAGIAQGKNRSGLNWFLLSLLLGRWRRCAWCSPTRNSRQVELQPTDFTDDTDSRKSG
jgi:hypothetical protein